MKFLSKSLIVLVYCAFSAALAVDSDSSPPGDAVASARALPHDRDLQGYVEYYLDDPAGDELRARYYSVDGQSLARKHLRYTGPGAQPVFVIHDYRSSTGYRVLPTEDRLRIQTLRLLENNYQAVVDVREIPIVEPTVVDAGFHRFLMERWEQVSAGNAVRFNFVQLDEARLVPMVLSKIACADAKYLCMRVTLSNFFQRLFVPPVLLTYDVRSRRLLQYSGFGPLSTETGHAFPVTMNYQYNNQQFSPATE